MKLYRPSHFAAACIVLLSILFMQLAVAGHACPEFNMGRLSTSFAISADAGSMPGCHGVDADMSVDMDVAQASLCHVHAQVGKQSLDKPESPHVQSFIPVALSLIFDDIKPAYSPISAHHNSFLLTRVTAPPLSIRNCCFRI